MMSKSPLQVCTDCGGDLSQVYIFASGPRVAGNTILEYRSTAAKKSFWTGKHEAQGQVLSLLCAGCSRIFLYGHDYKSAEMTQAESEGRLSLSEPEQEGGLSHSSDTEDEP